MLRAAQHLHRPRATPPSPSPSPSPSPMRLDSVAARNSFLARMDRQFAARAAQRNAQPIAPQTDDFESLADILGPLFQEPQEPKVPYKVKNAFDSVEEFLEICYKAAEDEHEEDEKAFTAINKLNITQNAWILKVEPQDDGSQVLTILVKPNSVMIEHMPKLGCPIAVSSFDIEANKQRSDFFPAFRGDTDSFHRPEWKGLYTFQVFLTYAQFAESSEDFKPLLDGWNSITTKDLELTDENAINVKFFLKVNDSTVEAEKNAIKRLQEGKVSDRQMARLQYISNFENPAFYENLFETYRHMNDPAKLPPAILERIKGLNPHQRDAYFKLLRELPCGIGIVPGGAGVGKSYFSMSVAGAAQSGSQKCQVLVILDINQPLDDMTANYIKMWAKAGIQALAIRLRNFGAELRESRYFEAIRKKVLQQEPMANKELLNIEDLFVREFRELRKNGRKGVAPDEQGFWALDHAAWFHYAKFPERFDKLTELLEKSEEGVSPFNDKPLRYAIWDLYTSTLKSAALIAGTPVQVSMYHHRMFKPDIVIFDEAAHAREPSTLIAVAYFDPTAMLFIGDHRQCLPHAHCADKHEYGMQLTRSMMERGVELGKAQFQITINYRARGALERLASFLVYNGKMISGLKDAYPVVIDTVHKIMGQYVQGGPHDRTRVPRYNVTIRNGGPADTSKTSKVNRNHLRWVMKMAVKFAKDPEFLDARDGKSPGNMMLLSPYKETTNVAKEMIEQIDAQHPELNIKSRFDARTSDGCQGSEADVIFNVFSADWATNFMDQKQRFNVSITRARIGELNIMSHALVNSLARRSTDYLCKLWMSCQTASLTGNMEGSLIYVDLKKEGITN